MDGSILRLKHLSKSNRPVFGRFAQWLRWQCAKHLFAECKGYVNLEQGAYFGNGMNFHVLGESCAIGKDFVCHNRIVTIMGSVIMGEDVLFQGGGHSFANPDVPIGAEGNLPDGPLEIGDDDG